MADPHFDPAALPFPEAEEYWRKKIKLPTSGYTDVWGRQHALSFVVAGANEDRLIEDLYNAIDQARTTGGYEAFRERFDDIVKEHGWAHHGSPGWRSQLIYNTNVRQAWLAGKFQQQEKEKVLRPYRIYIHSGAEHYRPEHRSWDGKILSCDDPWWDTHMPQNGYNCGCDTDTLSRREARIEWEARGKSGPDESPEIEWEEKIVGKNGSNPRVVLTPKGIDPGFATNPGKAYLEPHTVPPLTGYDAVLQERKAAWPTGFTPPPAPAPTKVPASALLPANTPPEQAVSDFLGVFGASMDQGATFTDAAGSTLAITKALFQDGSGQFKWLANPGKATRIPYTKLLASTLATPDEIWWAWEASRDAPGQWLLKRRYLKAFEVEGAGEYGIAAFEWGKTGWLGSTAFVPDHASPDKRQAYFNRQRVGRLVWEK
jgi:SPP1 gp7 family putative phage head morphogenesis protein